MAINDMFSSSKKWSLDKLPIQILCQAASLLGDLLDRLSMDKEQMAINDIFSPSKKGYFDKLPIYDYKSSSLTPWLSS